MIVKRIIGMPGDTVKMENDQLTINGKKYNCYSVFYPIGNGRFNIDKSIEDILYIKESM